MYGTVAPRLTVLPRMLHQRYHHQPVLLYGCLYVFGGSKSVTCKNNNRFGQAEVLDMSATARRSKPSEWQWQPIASTGAKRDLYVCVAGNIYVTGGVIDRPRKVQPLISRHSICYQTEENRWKQLSLMRNSRCGHALAVLGHKIYVFGGSGEDLIDSAKDIVNMKSAEVYDAHNNMWTLIEPMLRPRYGGSAIEIEGKIYVIGGDQSNEGEITSSVECFDPLGNCWTLVCESVDDQGLFDSIAVIDDPEYFLKGN